MNKTTIKLQRKIEVAEHVYKVLSEDRDTLNRMGMLSRDGNDSLSGALVIIEEYTLLYTRRLLSAKKSNLILLPSLQQNGF